MREQATAKTEADPYGMTSKKSKSNNNGKSNSRSRSPAGMTNKKGKGNDKSNDRTDPLRG
jgi:hypothetical protein